MARVKTVTDFLENIAPLELQEDYDNSGLITGSSEWKVKGVICSLDCTPDVVQEAIDQDCNLIVCHHPIIFEGLKKLSGDSYIERAVVSAIRHDVAIYAIHTNLDNVMQHGVNQKIAERLGLENCSILAPKNEVGNTGAGLIGHFAEPMKVGEFFDFIKTKFELEVFRYTHSPAIQKVQKVVVCGGSGSFLLENAVAAGTDVFITADFKYHQFFDADNRVLVLDIGHYESEKFTIQLLHELIFNNFRNFAAQMTKVNTNPVRYFR